LDKAIEREIFSHLVHEEIIPNLTDVKNLLPG